MRSQLRIAWRKDTCGFHEDFYLAKLERFGSTCPCASGVG